MNRPFRIVAPLLLVFCCAIHVTANDASEFVLATEYATYNEKYFGNKLPKNTIVVWDTSLDSLRLFGATDEFEGRMRIRLAPQMNSAWQILRMTLLHEMVHVKLRKKNAEVHGKEFQREMRRLAKKGAFEELW